MQEILDVIKEALIDSLKILPFLFATYLIMEYIEHKVSNKSKQIIKKSGKLGSVIGGALGLVPQCGFCVSATNLYAGRIITIRNINFNILNNFRRDVTSSYIKWC